MTKVLIPPATGKVLIAEPFMNDSYFQRSVVLLVEHNENDGSVGFILNKETNVLVCDVLNGFPQCDIPLFFGGTVQTDTIHFIHTLGEALDGESKPRQVMDGIWWGGDLEKLKYMIDKKMITRNDIRFFAGYSGWEPAQLKAETQKNTWLVHPCNKRFAFLIEAPKLWGHVLRTMGSDFAVMANFPVDPLLN